MFLNGNRELELQVVGLERKSSVLTENRRLLKRCWELLVLWVTGRTGVSFGSTKGARHMKRM